MAKRDKLVKLSELRGVRNRKKRTLIRYESLENSASLSRLPSLPGKDA